MTKRLYVGRLTFETSSQELAELFAQAGTVESASVVEDREIGRSRGFGFVETASKEEGEAAIAQFKGPEVGGRALTTDERVFAVGDRVVQLCITCGEVCAHIVASISKKGRITRVSCPKCGSRVPYKSGVAGRPKLGSPHGRARSYRRGQTMMHPTFGVDVNEAKPREDRREVDSYRGRRDRGRFDFVEIAVNKEGEYIFVGPVDELKGATLIEDKQAREQVQRFFSGITESRKRARKLQIEINRLKRKTQAVIDKLA